MFRSSRSPHSLHLAISCSEKVIDGKNTGISFPLKSLYSIVKVPKFFPKVTDLNFDQNLNIFETATGVAFVYVLPEENGKENGIGRI